MPCTGPGHNEEVEFDCAVKRKAIKGMKTMMITNVGKLYSCGFGRFEAVVPLDLPVGIHLTACVFASLCQ